MNQENSLARVFQHATLLLLRILVRLLATVQLTGILAPFTRCRADSEFIWNLRCIVWNLAQKHSLALTVWTDLER